MSRVFDAYFFGNEVAYFAARMEEERQLDEQYECEEVPHVLTINNEVVAEVVMTRAEAESKNKLSTFYKWVEKAALSTESSNELPF